MALTPEEVENKRFQPTKFREGYDQVEVDDFLDEVVAELRRLSRENEELRQKLSACEQRVGELSRSGASGGTEEAPAPRSQGPSPAPPTVASTTAAVAAAKADRGSPEAITGMLAMAQQLHDDHVRTGEQQRDKIITEAKEHASRLVHEAEETRRDTLGSLERERSLLERKIDELRAYEREYRSRLKAYLESQLRELETRGSLAGGSPDSGVPATAATGSQPAGRSAPAAGGPDGG